jgi:predicted PurR-regulated permease PerM
LPFERSNKANSQQTKQADKNSYLLENDLISKSILTPINNATIGSFLYRILQQAYQMLYILNLLSFLFFTAFIAGFLRKDAEDLFVALEKFFKDLSIPPESSSSSDTNPNAQMPK